MSGRPKLFPAKQAAPRPEAGASPWNLSRTDSLADYRIFNLRRDYKTSPRTGAEHDFYVLECPDWVNVVALTPDRGVVLVEQFRHGTNTVELEIPGGVVDKTDPSPLATGVRELREETGYEGENAKVIATVWPNPAIQTNACHTVLVENCVESCPVEFDQAEDLVTRLARIDELPGLVASGKIRHSLIVAALYHFELWRKARRD